MLNYELYQALGHLYGTVRVIDENVPLSGNYPVDPRTERKNLSILIRGESYLLNCPFCRDSRGRMSVNHRFCVFDPETGMWGAELWKCYNEECQEDSAHRQQLLGTVRDALTLPGPLAGLRRLAPVRRLAERDLEPAEFPGVLIPVDRLDADHPAAVYLESRRFDRTELAATWRVALAEFVATRTRQSAAMGRIVAPVTRSGVTVGWQARYPADLDWKATGIHKYLTFFPKSLTVYGLDQIGGAKIVTCMEGVTDVWRYGPGAVSFLGKSASPTQVRLLAEVLSGRPLVAVPDRDDPDSLHAFAKNLYKVIGAGHTGPVSVAILPVGTDPADHTREFLRSVVAEAAKNPIEV